MESSLSLKLTDLVTQVRLFLGFGTDRDDVVTEIVKSGLRQFYFPPPMEGSSGSYDWSFLRPTTTLPLPANASAINLPDDFGGIEGDLSILSTTSQVIWPIQIVGEGTIRQRYAMTPTQSGRPLQAAVTPLKGTSINNGQRFQLLIFPLADQAYTVQFTYYVLADALSGDRPFAYGGMAHAETILESCLCIAEQRLDDAVSVHSVKFKERLAASISFDRRLKPQLVGYNGDNSDCRNRDDRWRLDQHLLNTATYNGQGL